MCKEGHLPSLYRLTLGFSEMASDIATIITNKSALASWIKKNYHLMRLFWSFFDKLAQNRRGQSKSISVTADRDDTAPPYKR